MAESPEFFIVVPAYNEAARFPAFLQKLVDAFGGDSRILIQLVDDGSRPADREACEKSALAAGALCAEPIALTSNVGKGAAIRAGWEECGNAEWVGFLDADGAISTEEVQRVIETIRREKNIDAWFTSRVKMLGRHVDRSTLRHFTGRAFASIVGARIDPGVYDSQCGFKLVRREILEKFRDRLEEDGFAIDIDLLAGLNAVGARTAEIPIDWHDVTGSKVRFFRDSLRMLTATRRIRKRWML